MYSMFCNRPVWLNNKIVNESYEKISCSEFYRENSNFGVHLQEEVIYDDM
jgi:hypothetical protein